MATRKNDERNSGQLLSPLSAEDLKKVSWHLQRCTHQCYTRLVLTNGLTVVGGLSGRPLLSKDRGLTLLLPFSSKWQRVGIPFDLIAGGEVTSQQYPVAKYRTGQEIITQIDENLTHLIAANSLPAERRPSSVHPNEETMSTKQGLSTKEGVQIAAISYPQRTILYADWEALQRKMGSKKIGSINISPGFTVFGVNVQLTKQRSIQRFAWSKLIGKIYSWESGELCNGDELVLEGHMSLVCDNSHLVRLNPIGSETIDRDLIAVVWSKIGTSECDDNTVWANGVAGGISIKHVDHPLGLWEQVQNPLRVFGQVIHASVRSQWGIKQWFLKALAVGVLPMTPQPKEAYYVRKDM